jgi:phosphate-selective porin
MKKIAFMFTGLALCAAASANQPAAAQSDEAKAKAAEIAKAMAAEEAKAKAAHTAKLDAYKVCLAMDRAAAHYRKTATNAKPPTPTPACANPGPFVSPTAMASASAKR